MGLLERLRKPDWLGELYGLLLVILVLAGIGVTVGLVGAVRGQPVHAQVQVESVGGLDGGDRLRAGVAIDAEGIVDVVVEKPTGRQTLMTILAGAPTTFVVIALLVLLVWTVRAARRGDPFSRATVWRLRSLAAVALVGGVIAALVEMLAAFELSAVLSTASPATELRLERLALWMLVGFGLLAVAEVVSRGVAIRAELDEVI